MSKVTEQQLEDMEALSPVSLAGINRRARRRGL